MPIAILSDHSNINLRKSVAKKSRILSLVDDFTWKEITTKIKNRQRKKTDFIGAVGRLCRSFRNLPVKYSHLKTRFHSNPRQNNEFLNYESLKYSAIF